MELRDHPASGLHGPRCLFGSDLTGSCRWWRGGPAVQPLGVAAISDYRIAECLQPFQLGSSIQLASDRSLAKVMPFGEESGPVIEAPDGLTP